MQSDSGSYCFFRSVCPGTTEAPQEDGGTKQIYIKEEFTCKKKFSI
jgi:hypothetical protein